MNLLSVKYYAFLKIIYHNRLTSKGFFWLCSLGSKLNTTYVARVEMCTVAIPGSSRDTMRDFYSKYLFKLIQNLQNFLYGYI